VLLLAEDDVRDLLDVDELIDALAAAMADLSAGRASIPPRRAALIDPVTATGLLGMPCYVPSIRALTSKLVSVFPRNTGTAVPVDQCAGAAAALVLTAARKRAI
jgi:ornithine cyclodeaminase/alanine dehydrogenase-like protein (mu-crystallin family)